MVSADEAQQYTDMPFANPDIMPIRLAHTVVELTAHLDALRKIALDQTPHLYEGMCPDRVDGPDLRDPDCPACQMLGVSDDRV